MSDVPIDDDVRDGLIAILFAKSQGLSPTPRSQTAWYVNLVSGNDRNDGLTPETAVQHKAEIARRWGGWSAELNTVNVAVTYLAPDTDNSDPGRFAPVFLNGATLLEQAATPAFSFTGSLNAVTPKNIPGRQALTASFTTSSGAVTPNMVLVNTTRGNSRALAKRDTGGGVWLLTQPLAPFDGQSFPFPHGQVEVDTWDHGDVVTGYVPMNVNLEVIGGSAATSNPTTAQPSHVVRNMTIWDPYDNFNSVFVDGAGVPFVIDCVFDRLLTLYGAAPATYPIGIQGCAVLRLSFTGAGNSDNTFNFCGGYIVAGIIANARLANNAIVGDGTVPSVLYAQDTNFDDSQFYIESDASLLYIGGIGEFAGSIVPPKVYGPGILQAHGGTIAYDKPATSIFFCTLMIGGSLAAYANATDGGTGVVTTYRIASITGALLDAPAGATGYGGIAYVPGFGGFVNVGVTAP